jgi:putative aldouronate transport system permease protein
MKKLLSTIWNKRVLYLFILPAVVWYFIFCYVPMSGLLLSIKEYSFSKGIFGSEFAEPLAKYFKLFFNNTNFWRMIRNTVLISVLKLVTSFPAPIILALLLNEIRVKWFKRTVQTISYLPFFISWVIVVTMLSQILSPYGGPINDLKVSLFGGETIFFMGERNWFLPIVLTSNIWKGVGWGSIVYLAAMSNINPELYEAARIDGAGKLQMIFKITLPCISSTIGILFILAVGGLISAGYDPIYLLQQPGNLELSQILDTYIVEVGLRQGNYSIATVASMFQGVIALILVVITNAILRKTTEISLW